MNIKRAKNEIKNALKAYLATDEFGAYRIPPIRQRPILLMGPPGIGKTQIMQQIAEETGVGLVSYTLTHHTRQSALGLPFIEKVRLGGEERTVTSYTMSEIIASVYREIERTGVSEGILFLDEINCISETLTPMMLQFLQCKTFGNQQLPAGWMVVAAGNPPEYNKSVREFDVVTLDRVKKIDIEEDFGVWKEYAGKRGIHGAILSYLEIRRDNFYRVEATADGLQFVTARGWEDLSELMQTYETLGLPVDRQVVEQYLQLPQIASDFANYLQLYEKYRQVYRVDEIISGTWEKVRASELRDAPFDEKLGVLGLLLSRLADTARAAYRQDALTDALLGAAALGDIGKLFPDTDPAFKGADSRELLREAWRRIQAKGYTLGNVDVTIIAQAPKMLPHIPQMRVFIAEDLGCHMDDVNVKATTTEKLGFTGRGEGIACEAVALLRKAEK